jgi:alpha/beta superfamily hydrolase
MSVVRAPRSERLSLPGPAGPLEALIETPLTDAGEAVSAPPAFAVACHPHPLHGGTLDNKVVHTLARAFNALGAPSIRFNFRGVGASAGAYDEGRGETEDALAVIAYGRRRWPGAALWLGGFSFGGSVAVRAADRAQPQRLVAVAPGVTTISVAGAAPPACPWLIIQGDADDVVAPDAVLEWVRTLSPVPEVAVLAGAGHYFHGRINELREVVLAFMARAAGATRAA